MLTIACKRGWLTNCQISITIKREVLLAVLKNYANLSLICQLGRNKKKKIWESWQFGNDRKFINNLSTFKCNFHAASLCHNTQRSSISPLQLWLITKSLIRSKGIENSQVPTSLLHWARSRINPWILGESLLCVCVQVSNKNTHNSSTRRKSHYHNDGTKRGDYAQIKIRMHTNKDYSRLSLCHCWQVLLTKLKGFEFTCSFAMSFTE